MENSWSEENKGGDKKTNMLPSQLYCGVQKVCLNHTVKYHGQAAGRSAAGHRPDEAV